jgi:hypothetical protein
MNKGRRGAPFGFMARPSVFTGMGRAKGRRRRHAGRTSRLARNRLPEPAQAMGTSVKAGLKMGAKQDFTFRSHLIIVAE